MKGFKKKLIPARVAAIAAAVVLASLTCRGETAAGSVAPLPAAPSATPGTAPDTARKVSPTLWISQLIGNGFHINDPGVDYPRFPRFLLKVYNWGDRTFNKYDTDYVVSSGKNWKVQGKSYNWMELQSMIFPKHTYLNMHSDVYIDAGAYISFMALSVGYMFNVNELLGRPTSRHTFNLDFTCSRFSGSYTTQSSHGGMVITRLGNYNGGHNIHHKYNDVDIKSTSGDLYYFFNHRRYSRAAAYCFSKYQLRSAGSWIAGLSFARQSIHLDFKNLPPDMLLALPLQMSVYSFKYNDYTALGGYGYNWVLRPSRWLLNATGLIALGYKHSFEESTDGRRDLVANNFKLSMSGVYNYKAFFSSLQFRFDGFFYYNSNFTFFNSFTTLSFIVGARF